MNEKRKEEVSCDFKIFASGKCFSVHRLVLHTSSEYFRAMLSPGMKECAQGYCEFNEDSAVVEHCIEYIYTGTMNLQLETVAEILRVSHQWLLDGAVTVCSKFMKDKVSTENCVAWINLSKLYALRELESTCMTFLFQNLVNVRNIDELNFETLQSLLTKTTKRPEHAKVLWNIIKVRIQRADCEKPCDLIHVFHVERLTMAEFQSSVLKDAHVVSCGSCIEYATKRWQAHAYRNEDIKLENCLAMKEQALKYGAVEILAVLDKFIVKRFRQVCKRKEFLTLVTEEHLLSYVSNIQRKCTQEEFNLIIKWFRSNPTRESSFPKMFQGRTATCSQFQHCLHTLTKRNRETILSDPSNCCYLRHLAEKYSCDKILEETEYFIHWNFEEVSACDDIAFLSVEAMESYASTESLCSPDGGWTMFSAVTLWGRNEERHAVDDFSRVFCALLFDKFSLLSLQRICNNALVKKSVQCCTKLLEVTLSRMSENRNLHDSQNVMVMSRISACDGEIVELKKQYKLIDDRSRNSRQDLKQLKERTDEIEAVQANRYFNWSDLNEANGTLRESIDRIQLDLTESITNFMKETDKLQRENENLRQRISAMMTEQYQFQDNVRANNGSFKRFISQKMEGAIYTFKSDIENLQEEHDDFRKRATWVLIGCVAVYCCYKMFIRHEPPSTASPQMPSMPMLTFLD